MRFIVGGVYAPLFKAEGVARATTVSPFYLDIYPVTNAQYGAFVQANRRWRRSQVCLLADAAYLQHWQADFPPPEVAAAIAQRPVTHVSWFAARACTAGSRSDCPANAEWELVAWPVRRRQMGVRTWLSGASPGVVYLPTPAMPLLIGSGQKTLAGSMTCTAVSGSGWPTSRLPSSPVLHAVTRRPKVIAFVASGHLPYRSKSGSITLPSCVTPIGVVCAGPILFTIWAFGVQRICHEAVPVVERSCRADRGPAARLVVSHSDRDRSRMADHATLSAAAYSARSIYQLESGWTTAAEQPLRLGQLRGKSAGAHHGIYDLRICLPDHRQPHATH